MVEPVATIQPDRSPPLQPSDPSGGEAAVNDLGAGRVAAELHIGAWPPPVTQTLLRQGNGRLSLTVRGKPSGRLRVALERAGFAPIVVRTVHLRLRTPTI